MLQPWIKANTSFDFQKYGNQNHSDKIKVNLSTYHFPFLWLQFWNWWELQHQIQLAKFICTALFVFFCFCFLSRLLASLMSVISILPIMLCTRSPGLNYLLWTLKDLSDFPIPKCHSNFCSNKFSIFRFHIEATLHSICVVLFLCILTARSSVLSRILCLRL